MDTTYKVGLCRVDWTGQIQRQKFPLLSCHYSMSLSWANLCLAWMGQTLNMLLLVKCCSFSQKYDEKYRIALFLFLLCTFYHFSRNESTKDMWKLLRHQKHIYSSSKTYAKPILFQECMKQFFQKSGNFGTHAIVASFLSCFSRETQISF